MFPYDDILFSRRYLPLLDGVIDTNMSYMSFLSPNIYLLPNRICFFSDKSCFYFIIALNIRGHTSLTRISAIAPPLRKIFT